MPKNKAKKQKDFPWGNYNLSTYLSTFPHVAFFYSLFPFPLFFAFILQKSKLPKIQKSKNPKIQKSRNPKIQKSRNPKIQKSRSPEIQNPKIQTYKKQEILKS